MQLVFLFWGRGRKTSSPFRIIEVQNLNAVGSSCEHSTDPPVTEGRELLGSASQLNALETNTNIECGTSISAQAKGVGWVG